MHPNTRACVAYIAARLISHLPVSWVYDYSQSRHIIISGTVSESSVSLYDYDRGCYVAGSASSFHDYGRSAEVSLKIEGNQFSGYDYGDDHHFSGSVDGELVIIYDFGESAYFNYSV